MNRKNHSRRLTCIAAMSAGLLASPAAFASDKTVQLSAHVPIQCEADLTGVVTQLTPGSYQLGSVRQFCNAPFMMSVSYQRISSEATFQFKGNFAAAGSTQTRVSSSLSAANDTAPFFIHGVDEQQAANISNTLVLSLTPLGV